MKKLLFLLVGLIVLVAACSDKNEPQAIDGKTDKCAFCNMAVKDNPHATELITDDGEINKFDDLGCLFKWQEENSDTKVSAKYVRDYDSKKWIDLDKASYVYDSSFTTPMGYGIYAFKDKAAAQAFIEKEGKGELMTSKDLDSHEWKSNMNKSTDMMK